MQNRKIDFPPNIMNTYIERGKVKNDSEPNVYIKNKMKKNTVLIIEI